MDRVVTILAENPYAIAAGLLLSALPLLISTVKMLVRIIRFIFGVLKVGLQNQIRRARWGQARRSYAVRSIDRLIELCTIRIMKMIAFATSNIMIVVVAGIYVSEKFDGLVPDPIYPIQSHNFVLFLGIITVATSNILMAYEGFQIATVFKNRRRLLKKAKARAKRS